MDNPFESSAWLAGFSLFASGIFMCTSSIRLWFLRSSPHVVAPTWHSHAKQLAAVLFVLTTVGTLAEALKRPEDLSDLEIGSFALAIVSGFMLLPLSWVEHRRSLRPSHLAVIYLLMRFIRDAIMLSHFSVRGTFWRLRTPILLQMILAGVCLLLESISKDRGFRILPERDHKPSPEETSGLLSMAFMSWTIPFLARGGLRRRGTAEAAASPLPRADLLPVLPTALSPDAVFHAVRQAWDRRAQPPKRTVLIRVLLKFFRLPLLFAAPWRLCLIVFRFAQPPLMQQVITYVVDPSQVEKFWSGRMILIVTVFVFILQAVTTSVYFHVLDRLRVRTRTALACLVHDKAMSSQADSSSCNKVRHIIERDVANVERFTEMVHEPWAHLVEMALGSYMLYWGIGWLWPVPLFLTFLCSRVVEPMATSVRRNQLNWDSASKSRLSMMRLVLENFPSIKMLGLQSAMLQNVHGLRQDELRAAKETRLRAIAQMAAENTTYILVPALTFVVFTVVSREAYGHVLEARTAFPTIATLGLITHPTLMIMTITTKAQFYLSSFRSIQDFLLFEPTRSDERIEVGNSKASESPTNRQNGHANGRPLAVDMKNLSSGDGPLSLRDVNLKVDSGSSVIISGSLLKDKQMLLLSILGEMEKESGEIKMPLKIGYCASDPWLPNASFQRIIQGFSDDFADQDEWYEQVCSACCLGQDKARLPNGDSARIGEGGGVEPSSGLSHRLALARAIYARTGVILLDDTFSHIEESLRKSVLNKLLGPDGLLRRSQISVILFTNDSRQFTLVDKVYSLTRGRLRELERNDEGTPLKSGDHSATTLDGLYQEKPEGASSDESPEQPLESSWTQNYVTEAPEKIALPETGANAYAWYIEVASPFRITRVVIYAALGAFFVQFTLHWIRIWTDAGEAARSTYVGGYAALNVLGWLSINATLWFSLIRMAPAAGIVLHTKILDVISRLPPNKVSRDLSASLLARFDHDIKMADQKLPLAISDLAIGAFIFLAQLILFYTAQPYLLPTLPVGIIICYLLQRAYLRTSSQVRRYEREANLEYSQKLEENLRGVVTLRALGGVNAAQAAFHRAVGDSHEPFYFLLCLKRLPCVVLDLMVACLGVGVIILAVVLNEPCTAGEVGVALTVLLIAHPTLSRLVDSRIRVAASMDALGDLKDVGTNMPMEDNTWANIAPPENWPTAGSVDMVGVEVTDKEGKVLLKDVSLSVEAGQKAVICGSAGSAILPTLLRLTDLDNGTIMVDSLPLDRISRSKVREQCFVPIPLSPYPSTSSTTSPSTTTTTDPPHLLLRQATLRTNLDPTLTLSNSTLLDILARTGLWRHFSQQPGTSAMTSPVEIQDFASPPSMPPQHLIHGGGVSGRSATQHPLLDAPLDTLPPMPPGGTQERLITLARGLLQIYRIRENSGGLAKPVVLVEGLGGYFPPPSSSSSSSSSPPPSGVAAAAAAADGGKNEGEEEEKDFLSIVRDELLTPENDLTVIVFVATPPTSSSTTTGSGSSGSSASVDRRIRERVDYVVEMAEDGRGAQVVVSTGGSGRDDDGGE